MDTKNRLAREKSPYLLQHAGNPVEWFPWGEEAFAQARAEGKPIFLSVGYSTCHWCHVMAHESFENPETAAVLNELFVNVKLDREERPDIDRVYMTYVQATTGSGGWPMSVWLQPDLKPIFGGTYFPPDDRSGRQGFTSVCRSVAKVWREEREKVEAHGDRVLAGLREHATPAGAAGDLRPLAEAFREAVETLAGRYDAEWGGFGAAPKFPRPVTLSLLARIGSRPGGEGDRAREMFLSTLDHLIAGGMHDQLGGGFHRYSVDRYWHVPHFEKMLYDQAQLVVACVEAFRLSGKSSYARAARATLDYVRRDLLSPEGGFFCAEDADSLLAHGRPEHAEGAFYVWTQAEIEAALPPEEAALFCGQYLVAPAGNTPHGSDPHGEFKGKNILYARAPLEERSPAEATRLDSARARLLTVRLARPRPHLDDKIVTAWNGLMISAFALAYQTWGAPRDLALARGAADFLRTRLGRASDGALLRSYREGPGATEAFAEDYACLIAGLLDLYEAGFDVGHLAWAERLQEQQDALFRDPSDGKYFSASGRDASVLLRLKDDHDGAEPSASSVSVLNLARLAAMTGRDELRERARETARAFASPHLAQSMPLLLAAHDFLAEEPARAVIAGKLEGEDTQALLRAVRETVGSRRVVLLADGGDGQRFLAHRLSYLETAAPLAGRAAFYLCRGETCRLPVTDPAEVRALLSEW